MIGSATLLQSTIIAVQVCAAECTTRTNIIGDPNYSKTANGGVVVITLSWWNQSQLGHDYLKSCDPSDTRDIVNILRERQYVLLVLVFWWTFQA